MEDSSDILGGQLHLAQHDSSWLSPTYSSFTVLLIAVAAILFSLLVHHLYPHYRQFQERRYRKAMRRRHGIPDNDLRPFNVAYAAAKQAQLDRDSEERARSSANGTTSSLSSHTASQRRTPSRQRQTITGSSRPLTRNNDTLGSQERHPSYVDSRRTSGNTVTASESDFYGVAERAGKVVTHSRASEAPVGRVTQTRSHEDPRVVVRAKHALDDDVPLDKESKKTRLEGDDLIDGDEDATWHESEDDMEVDEASPVHLTRGAKRLASQDEDEGFESGRGLSRDKRPRKVSQGKDTEHGQASLKSMRGKKRDRAEATSTVGGDESLVEDDEEDPPRLHRRRRVVSNRKAAGTARGQKRGREIGSVDSDDETSDVLSKRAVRQKRGNRKVQSEDDLTDDGLVSQDPLCGGRHVGEEWESGGVHFKVGPNGRRLREALLKKSRSRFPMPKDSEHPDRDVNVDIFVEAWLTEEEYQAAKDRQELAWQQSPEESRSDSTPHAGFPESPSKGKNLLWASTSQKDLTVTRTRAPKQSLVPVGNLRNNPFQQSQVVPVRRISTVQSIAPILPDSPKLRPSKSYSKWEKQDLEAAAMAKLREKVKQVAPEPEKKAIAPPSVAQTTATPAITFTAPPPSAAAAAPKPTVTFATPASGSTSTVTKASTSDLPSLTIPTATPKVSEPAKPSTIPFPAIPSATQPVKPAANLTPPSVPTFFSSTTPSAAQPAVNVASTSAPNNIPNFFSKPVAAPAPSVLTQVQAPVPNIFGGSSAPAVSNPQPAQSPFSFAPSTNGGPQKVDDKPAAAAATSGPSLLSRMGGFGAPQPPVSAPAPAPTPASAAPASSFFSKPPTDTSDTPSSASATNAAPTSAPTGPVPLKFNFGVTQNPAGSSSAATEAPKPATTPLFGLQAQNTTANTAPASSNATTEPPKFSFGTAFGSGAKPNPFASSSAPQSNTNGTAQPANIFSNGSATPQTTIAAPKADSNMMTTPPAASNGFFGTNTANAAAPPSMFGKPSSSATPSFGQTGAPTTTTAPSSAFGTTAPAPASSNMFGNVSTTPAGKPTFNFGTGGPSTPFGQTSTTPAGTPTQPADAGKSAFAFGSTTPAGPPPAQAKAIFSFAPTSGATTNGANNASSIFGPNSAASSKPGPSAFGFGAPNKFVFGKPAGDAAQK